MQVCRPEKQSWVLFSHYRAVVIDSDLPFAKPSIARLAAVLLVGES